MGPVVKLYHKDSGETDVPEWQADDVLKSFPDEWSANPWLEKFDPPKSAGKPLGRPPGPDKKPDDDK